MEKTITEILNDAKNANIIAEGPNGEKYVSFEDYVNCTVADVVEKRNLIPFETNPDGSPAATATPYVAVSMEQLFLNRYCVRDDKLYIVTDWWCINEMDSGRIPLKTIPCYVVGRDDKNKLVYEKTTTISDQEFLQEFTGDLDYKAMAQVLPLISRAGAKQTKDSLPI